MLTTEHDFLFFFRFFQCGKEGVFDVLFLFLRFSGGKFNVDIIAGEFGSEADVLALFTDGDRLHFFGNDDFGFFAINFDFHDFGGAQCFTDIFGRIVAPGDDVDFFFVTNFVHDGLDANAAAADESADRINARNGGHDGDLGATTSFAGDATDFDSVVFELRDFLAEEIFDKFSVATRKNELSTAVATFDFFDKNFDTGTNSVIFAVDLLAAGHDARGAGEVDTDEFGLDAGDGAGDDGADFVLESGKNGVVFGFTQTLDDDLFGSLSGNAAKSGNFVFFFYDVAEFGIFLSFDGFV